MARKFYIIFVVIIVIVSTIYGGKIDKKSGIYARHHVDKCQDYKAVAEKCRMWKDLGFCFKHRKEMEFVCSKTCKFCDPAESHWSYTITPDENAKTKATIEIPTSPVVEVMGKKKALYLSSKDIAGMLQTVTSKDYGVTEKPTPKPKELAVIQGRIMKVEPVIIKTDTKGQEKISRPQISVGGKMQSPPKVADKEGPKMSGGGEGKSGNDAKSDSKETQDKIKERQKTENVIDNKLLSLMNKIIRGSADEKEKKPNNNAGEVKTQPLDIPEIMKMLQQLKEKNTNDNPGKEKQAAEQKPVNATNAKQNEFTKANTTDNSKALLQAMKLLKTVGPLSQSVTKAGNQSSLMEQLTTAAEEASVALKLLNKTRGFDKLKETKIPSGEGDVVYTVKLLQEELNKSNKNQSSAEMMVPSVPETVTANTSRMAVVNVSSSNPQLSEFILRLQNSINPQVKESENERAGVAVRKEGGKPTLSEVIPFDIKVDDSDSTQIKGKSNNEAQSEQTNKQDAKVTFQSDEEKIVKILNGLNQDDNPKKTEDKGSSAKDIVIQIRGAYNDLGEIINGVEIQEGINKKKKKENNEESEEETEDGLEERDGKKKKGDKKENKDEKRKKEQDEEKVKVKKKKDGDDEDDGDDDEKDDEESYDANSKPKHKKKKKLTKEQHLDQVLSFIKKAGHHLEMIGGKRVKMAGKKDESEEEDAAFTRTHNTQADWKILATKLARQLGLVLKKMAEKDEKYKAERNRLQSVLAALAQTELSTRRGTDDEETNDEGDEENDEENFDEDRSKIIHNMATKLLKFSKTVNKVRKSSRLKTVRKKKKVLHNLVSRYRSIVTKILANWMKLKGKKKSKIPKQKGVAKRGEIVRGRGNHTITKTQVKTEVIAYQKPETTHGKLTDIKSTNPVSFHTTATKKSKKKAKKKDKIPILAKESKQKENVNVVSDDEQDVLEIVHK